MNADFIDISNVVIFGDSMSDIGRKWNTPWGKIGIWSRQMLVNETGRFSDGKNWADFLIQWATGYSLLGQNVTQAISAANGT
ncbi:hypothetical protein [Streptomyces sp. 1222.5]|uniref:hypothetical protein n=1 Tax=Streptomyces sp. 1222.5 TaxID=1881026 RepID=UPI003D72F672